MSPSPPQLATNLTEEEWAARRQYRFDRLRQYIERHHQAQESQALTESTVPDGEDGGTALRMKDKIENARRREDAGGTTAGSSSTNTGVVTTTTSGSGTTEESLSTAGTESGGSDTSTAEGSVSGGSEATSQETGSNGDDQVAESTDDGAGSTSLSPVIVPSAYTDRPFADDSPWNRPIPADAQYAPAPGVRDLFISHTHGKDDYQNVGIAVASDSDPLRPILYNIDAWSEHSAGNWLRYGNPRSVEEEILARSSSSFPYDANIYSTTIGTGHQESLPDDFYGKGNPPKDLMVRVPMSALPSPDGDGHLTVFLPNGMALETYATIILSSGEIVAQMASFTDYTADGTGWWNGRRASMLPMYGGILREKEVTEETINHALAANISRAILDTKVAWPAYAYDTNPGYSGSLPMGALLAIPRNVDLGALTWQSSLGRALAEASQNHGIYLVDRGGGGISLITETELSHPLMNGWHESLQQDLDQIRDLLMWVSNNAP